MALRVIFGAGDDASLMAYGSADTDAGQPLDARAVTSRFLPAGPAGEAIFERAFLVVTHTMAAVLRVVARVPGGETEPVLVPLLAQAERVSVRVEVPLSVPYYDPSGTIELSRFPPRGAWCQLVVETEGGVAPGELTLDGCELEYEVVMESEGAT